MAKFFTRCATDSIISEYEFEEFSKEAFSHILWAVYGPPALAYITQYQERSNELTKAENIS